MGRRPGDDYREHFRVRRPLGVEHLGQTDAPAVVLVATHTKVTPRYQVVREDDDETLYPVGSPRGPTRERMRELRLTSRDFATHDAYPDYLLALSAKEDLLEEARGLTNELKDLDTSKSACGRLPTSSARRSAYSPDKNAYVSVAVTSMGTGYSLDGWSEGLEEYFAGLTERGKVGGKRSAKIGRLAAVRFDFVQAGEYELDTVGCAVIRNGIGFLFMGGTWTQSDKALARETASFLKSIKFDRK